MYIIKSPDYTKPGHLQSNHVTGKITPKVSEETLTPFIQNTMHNRVQGSKRITYKGRKVGTYPRHKKYTTSQIFHINYNWIMTYIQTILAKSLACPYIVFSIMNHYRNTHYPKKRGGGISRLILTSICVLSSYMLIVNIARGSVWSIFT